LRKRKQGGVIMKIGVIGSGNMGSGLGKIWAAKGHDVIFSYSRSQEKLNSYGMKMGTNMALDLIRR
jgi:predicted dinucleotide-binding enzyme